MFIANVLTEFGGAARFREIADRGISHHMLRAAREAGLIRRPLYGTYCLPATSHEVVMAAAYRGRLTCVSLCKELELPLLHDPRAVHLALPRDRARRADDRRPVKGIIFHRDDGLWEQAGINPVVAAIDAASSCCDEVAQLALCDAAIYKSRMTAEDLLSFTVTPPERLHWLIENVDGRAQSMTESYARIRLKRSGYTVEPQYELATDHHSDLLVDDCVLVELDSKRHHDNERAYQDDRSRDRVAIRAGYPTLRYTFADVFDYPAADMEGDIEAAKLMLGRE